jgi:hypothetical protein
MTGIGKASSFLLLALAAAPVAQADSFSESPVITTPPPATSPQPDRNRVGVLACVGIMMLVKHHRKFRI